MQERHDNDEIESHNHNEYPLLYKEAEIVTSSLGKFLECRKCYILLVTCALVIYLICMPSGIHIRQIPRAHVTTITYIHTYCICQNIRGGKLSRFITNVHYVGKTFAVCSLKAHMRLCDTDFRVCAN